MSGKGINEIRAILKRFYPRPGYGWLWDTECGDEDQWLLPLRDSNDGDMDYEAGVITISPVKYGKWGVGICIDVDDAHVWGTDNFIFVCNTPQEAKRKVDILLGWNSGEIPLFGPQ